MVSTRQSTKHRRGDASPGDSGEDYCSEEGSGSVAVRGPKSRTSRKATPKQKGKQPGKRRRAGKLSKLPDMPLDILYEVSYGINSVDCDKVDDGFGDCRYSVSSIRWIYCGCRGPTKPFIAFSHASPRGTFGWPLSITSPMLNDPLRVLRT